MWMVWPKVLENIGHVGTFISGPLFLDLHFLEPHYWISLVIGSRKETRAATLVLPIGHGEV